MESNMATLYSSHPEQNPGINWHCIYCRLVRTVKTWVHSAKVATWQTQREDIVADIVQEAIVRSLRRIERGNSGERPPVRCVESMCMRIAHNCFIDMIRRDQRLLPIIDDVAESFQKNLFIAAGQEENFANVAEENVFTASLFEMIVAEAIKFPPKLRTALFIDLACRMSFKGEPTPLQQAFLRAGIALNEYKQQAPRDPVERSRHASLTSLAYKRLRESESVQDYIASR